MHFICVPIRPLKTKKILLLSLLLGSFIFYIKFITNNTDNADNESSIHYGNRKLIAGKLINEYNGENGMEIVNSIEHHAIQPVIENMVTKNAIKYNELYEQWINDDIAKQERGLGDDGRAATLTDPTANAIGKHQLKKIALNEELSEHICYNRTLQDARNPLCQTQHVNVDELPTTSIIIIFYNEPYSVLVRTVHSVLNTVDPRLLKEIILVDDYSTIPQLKEKLDYYIQTRLPAHLVKIIRFKSR